MTTLADDKAYFTAILLLLYHVFLRKVRPVHTAQSDNVNLMGWLSPRKSNQEALQKIIVIIISQKIITILKK
jgi:hypothetical protein